MSQKVLVTGGAGFIGGSFVELCLDSGMEVIVVDKLTYAGDKSRFTEVEEQMFFYQTDILNSDALDEIFNKHKPDYVVHFAAESHVDRSISNPLLFLETNVIGTQTLLDCAKKYEVSKFVNISTDEVYGDLDKDGEFYESTPFNPSSPYSVSKASADMMGRAYYRTYGFPVLTVRPSNNYGVFQYPEKLIPVVVIRALRNMDIPVYGKGNNIREWLFVKDCALGIFEILIGAKVGSVYNIGSGIEKQNIDIVKTILSILDKPFDLITFVEDRLGHDFRYRLNSDKFKEEIGFSAITSFNEGIRHTVDWYIRNEKWWSKYID